MSRDQATNKLACEERAVANYYDEIASIVLEHTSCLHQRVCCSQLLSLHKEGTVASSGLLDKLGLMSNHNINLLDLRKAARLHNSSDDWLPFDLNEKLWGSRLHACSFSSSKDHSTGFSLKCLRRIHCIAIQISLHYGAPARLPMTKNELKKLSTELRKLTIVVIGDVFLDKYTHGIVRGTSRETPVPLYEFEKRIVVPGAAGNVACNFSALGVKVHLIGFIGNDDDSRTLIHELKERKVHTESLIKLSSMRTNSYEKLIARAPNGKPQEILLVQTRMPDNGIIEKSRAKVLPALKRLSKFLDAVVIVDQVSHLCDEGVFSSVTALCSRDGILSVGNSRQQIRLCKGFDLLVANELEAAQGTGIQSTGQDYTSLGKALLPQVRKAVLLTTGPDGMRLFEKNSPPVHHPSVAKEIIDITGAGDTALAAYVCARLARLPARDALFFSNAAAALAIAKPGTATATIDEISAYI